MKFGKFQTFTSPGVGDYNYVETDKVWKKSPVCKIGNGRRFDKISSICNYKLTVPSAYQSERDNSAPKKKLGVIGNSRRWL